MNKIWKLIGRLTLWVGWPVLWLTLRHSRRTRVLIIADNQLLVVKGWLGTGQWALPGGGLHKGEVDKAGAIREVKEETGLTLQAKHLKPLYSGRTKRHGLSFDFVCFVTKLPAPTKVSKQLLEITDIAWLDLKDLQPNELTADAQQALSTWRSS